MNPYGSFQHIDSDDFHCLTLQGRDFEKFGKFLLFKIPDYFGKISDFFYLPNFAIFKVKPQQFSNLKLLSYFKSVIDENQQINNKQVQEFFKFREISVSFGNEFRFLNCLSHFKSIIIENQQNYTFKGLIAQNFSRIYYKVLID